MHPLCNFIHAMHSLGATLQARLAFPAPCSRNAGGRPQLASNPAAACSLRLRRQRGRQRQRSLVHTRAWPAQAAALDLVLHAAETLEHVHSALQSGLLALPLAAAGAVPTPLPLAAGAFLAGLPTALQPSCFSESCQAQKDSLLIARWAEGAGWAAAAPALHQLLPKLNASRACPALAPCSLVVPLLVLAAAVAFLLRPPPQGSIDEGRLFEDESTGARYRPIPLPLPLVIAPAS